MPDQAGLPDRSDKYNDRIARNEGRITGFVREARGARVTGFTRSKKRLVEKVWKAPDTVLRHAPLLSLSCMHIRWAPRSAALRRCTPLCHQDYARPCSSHSFTWVALV